jgi:hypothetical protein
MLRVDTYRPRPFCRKSPARVARVIVVPGLEQGYSCVPNENWHEQLQIPTNQIMDMGQWSAQLEATIQQGTEVGVVR